MTDRGAPPRPAGWSDRQLDTLTALARAFAPGFPEADDRRRARRAAEILNAVADPADLRQLRLVVTALDSRAANLATGGGWRRISGLFGPEADRLLLGWATSGLGQRRTAFQAFKRLLLFLAWTDPGPDGSGNPAWDEIGYAVAAPAESPAPSITPLNVDRDAPDEVVLEADTVVVGSGAGGGVVAARLAAAGRDVLVVEAGPYVAEGEMPVLEGEAYRRLYLDQGTTSSADLGITIVAGAVVGGGTTINWTTCFAPPDWLRDEWTAAGLEGFDAHQTDADVVRLREELGIQPPTWVPPKDRAILDGARALGWEHAVTERNAGPCGECGSCGFGCRYGTKRSGLRAHLASAHADGARVLADAPVRRVDLEQGRVVGVSGSLVDGTQTSRPFRVRAPRVVVAAGALRTPLILEAGGIAHPQLGRNLHLHPAVVVAARMPQPVDAWVGPLQAARSLQFVRGGTDHGGFFIETGPAHPGLAASAFPWEGGAAARTFMRGVRHVVALGAALRDSTSGRVFTSRAGRPRIAYRLDAADRRTAARALVEVSRLGRAAGATELIAASTPADRIDLGTADDAAWDAFLHRRATADLGPNRTFVFSAHQMGTARAGADARLSVCDPHGRVRGDGSAVVPGLYVADGSLFPSAAGVNPMLTIMTLAERTARAVFADA
jgi:choline dehydrogenase-like flavoprotein